MSWHKRGSTWGTINCTGSEFGYLLHMQSTAILVFQEKGTFRNQAAINFRRPYFTSSQRQAEMSSEKPRQDGQPWYQRFDPLNRGPVPEVPSYREQCPEYTAGLLSRLTFSWMTPIMVTGRRRRLEKEDIWVVNPERSVKVLTDRFREAFHAHVNRGNKHALLAALHDTFKREFWAGGIWLLVASLCQIMIPLTLRFLLNFVAHAFKAAATEEPYSNPGPPLSTGLLLVFVILLMQLVQSVGTSQFIYHGFMVGSQTRAVLVAVLFEKSLHLSERARVGSSSLETESDDEDVMKKDIDENREGYSPGRITTLMSSDAGRVDTAAGMFHIVWVAPIQILLSFALLLLNLTYSAVAGFGVLLVGIVGLTIAIKPLIRRRKAINAITDARISLTHEILGSVRFIKYNAWESLFLAKLGALRGKEVNAVTKLNAMRNAQNSLSIALPIFGAMVSFIVYSKTGHALVAAPVFSSLALFTALRVPFNLLPVVIGQLADAWSALGRLNDVFMAEEHREDITWVENIEDAIKVENASFVWEMASRSGPKDEKQTGPFSLNNINFSVRRGELLAVIGSVGAGKSSLLSALAGIMRKTHGQVTLCASSRAYCPQRAWIQNATLKENIVFGQPLDHEMYNRVIQACCLDPDIDALPAGEETEIGERGVNLSGGQQQRVNLARAIYSDSDLILMDDPLSAVDSHVGKHIFDDAICGVLRGKTRILSTHQLHVLSRCDRILWLEEGDIKAFGTFAELLANEVEFRHLMERAQKGSRTDEAELPKEVQTLEQREHSVLVDGSLVKDEEKMQGGLSWDVIRSYVRCSGNVVYGIVPVLLLILAQSSNALTSIWLSFWTSHSLSLVDDDYIGLYITFGVLQALLLFAFGASVSVLSGRATRRMVDDATARVIEAPVSFHDTQPLGRIMNRLSRDVEVMDSQLPESVRMFLYTIAIVTSIIVLLSVYFHWFLVAPPPLAAAFLYATAYYRSSATQLKRHEATLRGVMFARFGESVTGVPTIRAYGVQSQAIKRVYDAIDDMDAAYLLTLTNQRWVTCRLDIVAILAVTTAGLMVVLLRNKVDPSVSGLVLSYCLAITQMMQLAVRQLSEVENAMISTERMHEYGTELPREPSPQPPGAPAVSPSWPDRGEIIMTDAQLRYRPDLPLVLGGLNMSIRAGERIGIVGRTGAGKSSISTALFRLVELSAGTITIDSLNIAEIPLLDLRSRISIIPQDPSLFRGSIRSNLDPFDQHSDLELWSALHRVGLHTGDTATRRFHLDAPVEERGANFSEGQRQLMSIARALLRNSRIVLCDEATSSLDLEADSRIQRLIMESFSGKTVLTIAHRLKTVVGYDRVCVLEQGRIVEFDEPLRLWEREKGMFRGLCDKAGVQREDFQRGGRNAFG